MIHFVLCLFVCLFVSSSLSLGHFGPFSYYADKCIVHVIKLYIERNNLQVELIRCRKKCLLFSGLSFAKRRVQCNIAHRTQIRRFRTQAISATSLSQSIGRLTVAIQCMANIPSPFTPKQNRVMTSIPESIYRPRSCNLQFVVIRQQDISTSRWFRSEPWDKHLLTLC